MANTVRVEEQRGIPFYLNHSGLMEDGKMFTSSQPIVKAQRNASIGDNILVTLYL